jgi:hypothetical protein
MLTKWFAKRGASPCVAATSWLRGAQDILGKLCSIFELIAILKMLEMDYLVSCSCRILINIIN